MGQVATLRELNLQALLRHRDREAGVWYLARDLDRGGSGWVMLSDLRALVSAVGYCSRRSLRRLLSQGEGTFWQTSGDGRLMLTGALKVARDLGADTPNRRVYLDRGDFGKGVKHLRARLTETAVIGPRGRMIAQATVGGLVGRCRQTVGGYLRRVARERQTMVSARKATDFCAELAEHGWFRTVVNGVTVLGKGLPNRYLSDLSWTGYGQGRHARRACGPTIRKGLDGPRRMYFDDPRKAARALQGGQTVYFATGQVDIFGACLWEGYEPMNGTVVRL